MTTLAVGRFKLPASAALMLTLACLSTAHAATSSTGDVTPANPAAWSSTSPYIGNTAVGTATIDAGSTVSSGFGYLGFTNTGVGTVTVDGAGSSWNLGSSYLYDGYNGTGTLNITNGGKVSNSYVTVGYLSGSTGTVTVDGAGSTWNCSASLRVGQRGTGTLNITNGGTVTAGMTTYLASEAGSTGALNFGSNGGALTTKTFYASPSQITGTGTINTRGMGLDADLLFDSTHGLTQTLVWNAAGQNVTLKFDLTGASGAVGDLGAGYYGNGTLTIHDGLSVSAGPGYLAFQAGSTGTANLDGGSKWNSSGSLYVGYNGAGTLNIAGGSIVTVASSTYLGYNAGSAGTINFGTGAGTLTTQSLYASPSQFSGTGTINTQGLVTDANLVFDTTHGTTQTLTWNALGQNVTVNLNASSSGALGAGFFGIGSLTITSGITVSTSSGYLGYQSGSNGKASIDGSASTWSLSYLYVGQSGTGTLIVSNGGKVTTNGTSYVGLNANSTGTATIDTASTWNSTGSLYVGNSGSGVLNIANAGRVSNASGYIGYNAGALGTVTVDGAGSTWANTSNLYIGYAGAGALNITNGGKISNSNAYVGYSSGAAGTVSIDGAASSWTNSANLYVGNSGSGTINISSGGSINVTSAIYLATNPGSSGTINFVGSGGTLTSQSLYASPTQFTGTGTVNTHGLVTDGDLLFDDTHGLVQALSWNGAGQNITVNLNVSGTNPLGAGYRGNGTLTIKNGQSVGSVAGYLGYQAGSTGSATVDGAGSAWMSTGDLYVGDSGNGTLSITNGGKVNTSNGYLAYNSGSSGSVTVDGAASTWTSSSNLAVGYLANGNLAVTNGGKITHTGTYSYIGYMGGSKGTVTVDGAGSTWTSANYLFVGYLGTGSLSITNGGKVTASGAYSYIGDNAGSSGTVTVDGSGSLWTSANYLFVGYYGTGALTITNGGQVSASQTYLGYKSGSTGTLTVDGSGSIWTGGSLSVGESGAGTLNIINGGAVNATSVTLAANPGASGVINFGANGGTLTTQSLLTSPAQVTGTGTINTRGLVSDIDLIIDANHGLTQTLSWTGPGRNVTMNLDLSGDSGFSRYLGAGYSGAGTLTIRDGQSVNASTGYLGLRTGSTGIASVDGPGSIWTITYGLYVGSSGTGTLTITNSAKVNSGLGAYIGFNAGSTGTVTVDGANSAWTNGSNLAIGPGAATLNITHGGSVTVTGSTSLLSDPDGSTQINFGANGGILTTQSLYASPAHFTGTGTINTKGLMTDGNVVFDAAHGLTQTMIWNDSCRNITINVNMSGTNALGVGYYRFGTLTIRNGKYVSSDPSYLGYQGGSNGSATVDGAGSTWNATNLNVGYSGVGTLAITNGGKVSGSGGNIAVSSGSLGTVTIDGTGSNWSVGNGISVGYGGVGTLYITHGGRVNTGMAMIGHESGSMGTVTIDGAGSVWTSTTSVYVGISGVGTLIVANGGSVSDSTGSLGCNGGSRGSATIDGAGSNWTNSSALSVNAYGNLNITHGGNVAASSATLAASSLLSITVGDNSTLSLGTGSLTNNGKILLKVAPAALPGQSYTPITAGSWAGSGTIQTLGGTWNATAHTFTASPITTGTAGTPATLDLSLQQRLQITDSATNQQVLAAFQPSATSSPLTLNAALLTPDQLAALQATIDPNDSALAGWTFAATGYTPGDPVGLSFQIGTGYSVADLQVWHYDGTTWTAYNASDLTYDGHNASFTVTGFSGYAITVPEPAALALLTAGSLALLRRRR